MTEQSGAETSSTVGRASGSSLVRRYYIRQGHRLDDPTDPIQKPTVDLFSILEMCGYRSLNQGIGPGRLGKISDVFWRLVRIMWCARGGDVVVFNIPANYAVMRTICAIRRLKGFRLVVHCYDIESLRYTSPMRLSDQERNILNGSDVILTPSTNTENVLRSFGVTSKCVPIEVWDYLYADDVSVPVGNGRVIFAGNPRKANFLSELGELSTLFTLWTDGYQSNHPNVESMGVGATPNRLREVAEGGWGLVWDGESIDGDSSGPFLNYTKVMTTHKGGLYLAAGLPLIVWSRGGMAPFVLKYELGICVESLRQLDDLLPALPVSQYEEYRRNACQISHKIRTGYFLRHALNQV